MIKLQDVPNVKSIIGEMIALKLVQSSALLVIKKKGAPHAKNIIGVPIVLKHVPQGVLYVIKIMGVLPVPTLCIGETTVKRSALQIV